MDKKAMNDLSEEATTLETSWRQYYDNPLTVATNAMLHINGGEDQGPISLIYQDGSFKGDPAGLPNTSVGGALEIKLTNGTTIEAIQGEGHVESILLQGGAEVVKREPEDLTRKCISPAGRIVLSDKRRPVLLQGTPQSDSPPALIPTQFKDEFEPVVKEEDKHRVNHTIITQVPLDSGDKMSAGSYLGGFPSASPQSNYETVPPYLAPSPQPYVTSTSPVIRGSPAVFSSSAETYYREYYQVSEQQYASLRQDYSNSELTFDRYTRPAPSYKSILTVDSSPDSGISSDTVPPREQALSLPQQQGFASYEDIGQSPIVTTDLRPVGVQGSSPGAQRNSPSVTPVSNARSWHDFSRHNEGDKIQIPKIHSDDDKIHIEKIDSPYGFKFFLETPISTSPRREDDRITYINKGQFYPITMEYIPDPEVPLKSGTVKSIVMLIFREEKSSEDESKAWHFWHGRQHSVKQRILDVDSKNSVGLVNCIEEVSHNAICVYWNPLESPAKINVAVQCLSTDFSSQKGVKGLPLHIQIDTYDDPRDTNCRVYHRAYCQIKVFCDKGAERKTRDEERRAQKRRINPNTRKKYEDLYHAPCDRSEFYTMADLTKEPVFFKPSEDVDKVSYMNMDMSGSFYNHDPENGVGVNLGTSMDGPSPTLLSPQQHISPSPAPSLPTPYSSVEVSTPLKLVSHIPSSSSSSPLPCSPPPPPPTTSTPIYSQSTTTSLTTLVPPQHPVSPKTNRFQYSLPQTYGEIHKEMSGAITNGVVPASSMEEMFSHAHKRTRLTPPMNERVMLFVRSDGDDIYTPLHLVPPGTLGLLNAIEQKFHISKSSIKSLFRKNKVGIRARIDDDMLRHYCNEDCFVIDIQRREQQDAFDITLIEIPIRPDQ